MMTVEASSPLWKVGFGGRYTTPRPSYLPPEVRGQDPIVPEGTDLAIWAWEKDIDTPLKGKVTRFYAIAFAGKANKPLWNYVFNSEASRQKQIDDTVAARRRLFEHKQKQQEERRSFRHGFQLGDILVASWGYDQTNVDFYQVTDAGEKEIVLRAIGSKVVREERGADYVMPVPDKFIGPELRRRPTAYGVKVTDVSRASKWDGKPQYETASGWGH